MRLPRWERDALAIWRIYRQLMGPKPPSNILASLIGPSRDTEDATRIASDDYAIQRTNRARRILRSLLLLALAYNRQDKIPELRAALKALPRSTAQGQRRTRPQYSARHWPDAAPSPTPDAG